jgi:hypothetical protein
VPNADGLMSGVVAFGSLLSANRGLIDLGLTLAIGTAQVDTLRAQALATCDFLGV